MEGIHLLLDHMANIIDPHKKQAKVISKNGKSTPLEYDRLVIGTGAVSVEPDIEGLQFPSALANLWEFFWSENDFLLTENSTKWYVRSVCTIFRHR
jgi:NADPH-dependent 2,4-dienoyl-CoA reductase/sulfur reductase-like enzyme